MLNQKKNDVFYTSRGKNYIQKIATEDLLMEITNILKMKIPIKKRFHLIIEEKLQDATFVGRNFLGTKIV